MALSGHQATTLMQILLLTLLLLAGSAPALPARPAMDRVRWQVDRVNRRGTSLGLVMSYVDEATALQASGYFTPWRVLPFVDLYGTLNAAVTVQTLIDVFSVSGIVHYGTAGSSNDSMSFGDVSVPKLVAYTGAWTWKKFKSPKESSAELSFGEYNIPNGGGNLLGSL